MIPIDTEHNARVLQRFKADYFRLQNQIEALQIQNEALSQQILAQIEKRKALIAKWRAL